MKINIFSFWIFALLFIPSVLCKKYETQIPHKEYFKPLFSSTLDGRLISTDSLKGKIRVIVFFSPNDCASCLNEILFWESSKNFFGDQLSVLGIISHPHKATAARYIKMLNIHIPVIFDSSSNLRIKYGINYTPGRIIFNNENEIIHKSDFSNREIRVDKILDTIKVLLNQ